MSRSVSVYSVSRAWIENSTHRNSVVLFKYLLHFVFCLCLGFGGCFDKIHPLGATLGF